MLENILPPLYYRQFLLLVAGLHILLSPRITSTFLSRADVLLGVYCRSFEKLYGIRFQVLNFHHLFHLPECVRLYGPLWTTSCFPFESTNGFLVRCITGTNNTVLNMTNSALCLLNLRAIAKKVSGSCSALIASCINENPPLSRSGGLCFFFFFFPFSFFPSKIVLSFFLSILSPFLSCVLQIPAAGAWEPHCGWAVSQPRRRPHNNLLQGHCERRAP